MALKLSYFNIKGRAELSRLVLAAADKKYEDFRYPDGEWAKTYKALTPFDSAPTLEIDGKMYSQSMAIATYLARETGLYGTTSLECLEIDQWVQLVQDLFVHATKAFGESDPEKKAAIWLTYKEEHSVKYMNFYEKGLKNNGTGFLVGNKMTLADLVVFDLFTGTFQDNMCSIDNFPLCKALCDKVTKNPGIAKWVAQRK